MPILVISLISLTEVFGKFSTLFSLFGVFNFSEIHSTSVSQAQPQTTIGKIMINRAALILTEDSFAIIGVALLGDLF